MEADLLDSLAAATASMLRSLAAFLRPECSDDELQELLTEWSSIERAESK